MIGNYTWKYRFNGWPPFGHWGSPDSNGRHLESDSIVTVKWGGHTSKIRYFYHKFVEGVIYACVPSKNPNIRKNLLMYPINETEIYAGRSPKFC